MEVTEAFKCVSMIVMIKNGQCNRHGKATLENTTYQSFLWPSKVVLVTAPDAKAAGNLVVAEVTDQLAFSSLVVGGEQDL